MLQLLHVKMDIKVSVRYLTTGNELLNAYIV